MVWAGAAGSRGFTLTETLVVSAVVSIMIGLLLPALGGAREAARQTACAAMQKQLVTGLHAYGASEDEWIPGFNTSGRALWPAATPSAIARLSRDPHAPVQVNDWMTPALRDEPLPANREERFYTLFERIACPCMELRAPVWIGGDQGSPAMADWLDAGTRENTRGVSYLMPTNFQLFGGPRVARDAIITQHSSVRFLELARICRLRADYAPRQDQVGLASRKIAVADGFRYLGVNVIDFDASYSHANWGSFTERSACDIDSRAWGRRGGGGTGYNLGVVYRHKHRLNAAMWDGHVEALSPRDSRDPALWAPTRSALLPAVALDPDSKSFGVDPARPDRNRIP